MLRREARRPSLECASIAQLKDAARVARVKQRNAFRAGRCRYELRAREANDQLHGEASQAVTASGEHTITAVTLSMVNAGTFGPIRLPFCGPMPASPSTPRVSLLQ
jgi:hypothetical protein